MPTPPSLPDGPAAVQAKNLQFAEQWTRGLGEVSGVPVMAASVYELVQLLNAVHVKETAKQQ